MHELGQKDDGVAMAHLSLLGEQGMCRFLVLWPLGNVSGCSRMLQASNGPAVTVSRNLGQLVTPSV